MSDSAIRHAVIRGDRPWSTPSEDYPEAAQCERIIRPLSHPALIAAAETVKAFLKTAERLLTTRLAEHRPFAPPQLRQKCHALIIGCPNGIVLRYDISPNDKTVIGVGWSDAPAQRVVPLLSGGIVGFADSDPTIFQGGSMEISIAKSDGTKRVLDRLVAKMTLGETSPVPSLGRPPLIGRMDNEMEFSVVGELISEAQQCGTPFVTRTKMRFPVGFQTLEVYSGLNAADWKPDSAEHWAEHEILAATARAHVAKERYVAMDPHGSARNSALQLLAEFEKLLDENEEVLHQFLRANPHLLCPTGIEFRSKVPFGRAVSDFVVRRAGEDYLLVELEKPNRLLFRSDGQQTEHLTHALDQLSDWIRYIEDNPGTMQRELALPGLTTHPECWVVMGRTAALTPENRRKIQVIEGQMPRFRILTYEDLLAMARQNYENLFGPLAGLAASTNTEIYYPKDFAALSPPFRVLADVGLLSESTDDQQSS